MERSHQFSRTRPCQRFLDSARNDRRGVARNDKRPVISTKQSAWRDLIRFLDFARNDKRPVISTNVERSLLSSRHQILPLLIHGINQPVLLVSRPLFQLFLPCNCLINIRKRLKVHQLVAIILLREARNLPRPMFRQTPLQIIRHTDVQCRIAIIGKNVSIVLIHNNSFSPVISTNVERSRQPFYCVTNTRQLPSFSPRSTYFLLIN